MERMSLSSEMRLFGEDNLTLDVVYDIVSSKHASTFVLVQVLCQL